MQLRQCLNIHPEHEVVLERFSDSVGGFITLDPTNTHVFKALLRAAKAKGKLRLKATVIPVEEKVEPSAAPDASAPSAEGPVIVHSASDASAARGSKALDCRSVGSGIFQYREARASQQTLVDGDAPVPCPFATNEPSVGKLASDTNDRVLAFRTREPLANLAIAHAAWSVYCNKCDVAMADSHYHCGICDGGDYDLCEGCVASGESCPGDGHWLVKRFIKDGKVVNSTTERIGHRYQKEAEKEMPGAFAEDSKMLAEEPRVFGPTRTCNNCVVVLPERQFVTCTTCDDFDLCLLCHHKNQHHHHPRHAFEPAAEDTILSLVSQTLLKPGRNVAHNAICDGCDKKIYGVRHKCQDCPDWDYCHDCVAGANNTHRGHRFAPIYDSLAEPQPSFARHFGIYCDGPLCSGQSHQNYIAGVRYKCAVCHDTDFCASCEALPTNHHNRTHPLIKFKTPVRNVSITTVNEDLRGNVRNMGDKLPETAAEKESTQTNAATPVQTIAEIKPTEEKAAVSRPTCAVDTAAIMEVVADLESAIDTKPAAVVEPKASEDLPRAPVPSKVPATLLSAVFVRDHVADGTVMQPGARFTQIWTLRNEGPHAWPAGCSVRFVGGDNMLNVDNGHPASVTDIADATESSVVGREVQVGEEISFKITLKAPIREGRGISYWRLKAADGTPFGHRLWCDIEVKRSETVDRPAISFHNYHAYEDAVRSSQSRMEAMRQTQQRMLQHQQMLRQQQGFAGFQHAQMGQAAGASHLTLPHPFPQDANPNLAGPSWSFSSEDDKVRKDAAKLRVEAIKAKIIRARAEKNKAALEAQQVRARVSAAAQEAGSLGLQASAHNLSGAPKQGPSTEEKPATEEPVAVADEVEEKDVESTSSSQMVFPKLDKESPSSSIIASASSKGKAAYVENEHGEVERSTTPTANAPVTTAEPVLASPADDDFEEVEVLSASGLSDEDDGFLTDEEYDILDASDRETVASP